MGAPARRRPAVPPGLAFLAGVAGGWPTPVAGMATAWGAGVSFVGILLAALARPRHPRLALALLLCSVCGLGATLARLDRDSHERRAAALLGEGVGSIELHFRGRLLSSPEAAPDGSRSLVLRGTPEGDAVRREVSTVRLIVRPSPPDPTRALDGLRPGDSVRVWCRLFRPRGVADPGHRAPSTARAANGFDALGSVKSARLVERARSPSERGLARLVDRVRRSARRRLDAAFRGRPAGRALAGAMLLGDRRAIGPESWRVLRDGGLVHLVAISGLHVGLLGAASLAALRRSRLPAALRLALVVGLLAGFGQLVGLRPSVLRAVLTAAVFQVGRVLGRDGDPLNTLVLVACALVSSSPASLFDPGLELTFAATAGILLAADGGRGRRTRISEAFRVSGAAYLATAPLAAWHFGRLAPICVATNLAAVPLCAAVLASGYAAILLGPTPFIGSLAAGMARASTGALLGVARAAAGVDAGAFAVPSPSVGLVTLYYLSALSGLATRGPRCGRERGRCALRAAFAVAALLIHLGPPPLSAPSHVRAAVIDVGQGQAVAVGGPRGGTVLFDTGGSPHAAFEPGERIVLPFLLRTAGRRIETLVLSHDDIDHAGGAATLLREIEVGELCLPPGYHESPRLGSLAGAARAQGTAVRACGRGVELERAGLPISILAPDHGHAAARGNDGSVVARVGVTPYRLLIPGDLELGGEAELLDSSLSLRAEALVVPHHGSRSGTSAAFIRGVGARVAIVSCGYHNAFGHPHPDVCRRLRSAGATLWRTDLDGMLLLEGRGGRWRVKGTRR